MVSYEVSFLPKKNRAEVQISLSGNHGLKSIDFNLNNSLCRDFQSEDELLRSESRIEWRPSPASASQLSYRCKIKHRRTAKQRGKFYDAYINNDWVIARGDDLVPAAVVRRQGDAKVNTALHITLPSEWTSVRTGWPLLKKSKDGKYVSFRIDDDSRVFDRPTGWIIAGDLGTRIETLNTESSDIDIEVSAPKGSDFKRMDRLAFLTAAWPSIDKALQPEQKKLLIVGAGKPMWRGGLSAGNSFYIHEDRPLISENGTSTLLHELFHTLTGIVGDGEDDWIAEGLAEYYSIEFLYRAGFTTKRRKDRTMENLKDWSSDVTSLLTERASGEITAAAVLFFGQLDKEIQQKTENNQNLDSLAQALMYRAKQGEKISLDTLKKEFKALTNTVSATLKSDLLVSNAGFD